MGLVVAGVVFWRSMQPDKRLVVPAAWRTAAKGVPWLADALSEAAELQGEVGDRLAESIARLTKERTEAVGWLTEAYAVLVEAAASEFDAAVTRMHGSLADHKEELRHEVEAQREINQALKQ